MSPLRELFQKGEFQKIIARVPSPGRTPEEVEVLIGALSFVGRFEEAVDLWTLRQSLLSDEEKVRARFAMALAALRASHFRSAKKWFLENHKTAPATVRDFAAQGVALYEYFMGRFREAARWGRRARRWALENGNSYTRFLATDLLGHAFVQLGRRSEGLTLLGQSVAAARGLDLSNTAESILAEKLIYECQLGWHGAEGSEKIRDFVSNLHAQSSYTRGNLHLEGARQLTLQGRWREARELLDQAALSIYQFGLRRQELTLQLRLAEIAYRQNDGASVLHFLQSARRCLHHVADQTFEIRVLGLELKFEEKARGMPAGDNPKLARLLELSRTRSDSINRQMLARKGWLAMGSERPSEDKLHDLMVLAATSPSQAEQQCLAAGWLGLWPEFRGESWERDRLIVLADRSSIVALRKDGVGHLPRALSAQSHRVLWALSRGAQDKEKLVSAVWGYRYDPLRHDSLIYAAMTHLRKSLGPWQNFVQTSDQGWRLEGDCVFSATASWAREADFLQAPPRSDPDPLSLRQEKALRALTNGEREFWDVKSFKRHFKVSPMTAFRDLKDLANKGYLKRRGRGRSTCYVSLSRKDPEA